jgi:hypothetical protein
MGQTRGLSVQQQQQVVAEWQLCVDEGISSGLTAEDVKAAEHVLQQELLLLELCQLARDRRSLGGESFSTSTLQPLQESVFTVSSATCQCSALLPGELLLLMLRAFNIEPDKVSLLHITIGSGYGSLAGKDNGAKAKEGFEGATMNELTYSQEEAVTAAQAEASAKGTFCQATTQFVLMQRL